MNIPVEVNELTIAVALVVVLSCLVSYLLARLNSLSKRRQQLQDELGAEIEKTADVREQLSLALQQLSASQASSDSYCRQFDEARRNCAVQNEQYQLLLEREQSMKIENADLRARQQENENHFKLQLQQLDEQRQILKKEFENIANKIFESKGQAFTEKNRQSLDALLNPFKQQIEGFRTKVEDIHHKETKQRAELNNELLNLQTLNQKITTEAHNLATALKGQKKMQGNWGEMVLENVLDRSGLQAGKDYKREVSFNTDSGRSRPDAIVYLPDAKHLVIDAKTSLNAYTRYVNAEEDVERQQALLEHVRVVGERIKELADKSYFDLPGLNSPDMVFMFIPIESAFVEAFKADETLYQRALEQNILVATPTTLLTSLNIVRQLWRFEDRNKHTAELAEKAAKVYDKLNSFVSSMEGVGKQLDKARDSYDKAFSQLYLGKGNLIKQAGEFKKLGVSVKTEIDQQLESKAELELEQPPQLPEPEEL